jgi:adenylate cyclase
VQFSFAEHCLDTDRRELHRGSESIAVEPQVFDLLVYLVQNRDRVVSKDDLIASVWGGRIVSESTLTSRINAARRAVGDSGKEQRLIRTVARKGLRFVGAVDEPGAANAPAASETIQPPAAPITAPPLPAKPSIAVLPFVNMSNDREHESFVDGLTEDLITDLSRNAGLFVIARNSTFAYKGRSVDVRGISLELGVRYLLEGSARREAGRVRINVQLIDAVGGEHIWAERFDRTLEDVFAVQDEVTGRIVEALIGRLTANAPRKRPGNIEAYDLVVRARVLTEESPQTAREAFLLLKHAIDLEPDYAEARGLLAYNRWLAWTHFGEPEDPNRSRALKLAEKAVRLDPNEAYCRYVLGTILAYDRRWEESDHQFGVALKIDPNHADTWAALSDMSVLSGRIPESLEQIQKALRLNPYPPSWYFTHLGQAQYAARDYESAIETLRKEETYRTNSRRFLAASLAQLGRLDEARREVEMFLVTHPHFTISHWVASQPVRDAAIADHFVDGFRKAGLPK